MSDFKTLFELDVKKYASDKQGLTYLSWSNAWSEFKKQCPNATYEIKKDENRKCWFGDEAIGYMVYTEVTVDDLTHEMWLPVMDHQNKSMKLNSYTYSTKRGDRTVEAISTMEINKTVMRCLTKNLAMFGLGLYIYNGEDLPSHVLGKFVGDEKVQELITLASSKGVNAKKLSDKVISEYSATLSNMDDFVLDNLTYRFNELPDK